YTTLFRSAGARAPGDRGCFQRCTPRRTAGALVPLFVFFGPGAAQERLLGQACAPLGTCSAPAPGRRAITGPAVQPLTWLPRGQWPRSGGTRGRPAFGRGTSSEIRALSRPASVAEKEFSPDAFQGPGPAPQEPANDRTRQDPGDRW